MPLRARISGSLLSFSQIMTLPCLPFDLSLSKGFDKLSPNGICHDFAIIKG
jgi:hypothetical protein